MGTEIERKFLVLDGSWKNSGTGTLCRQGYLSSDRNRTVRVRTAGGRSWLTVKGLSLGAARAEYEYAIPCDDAEEMLSHLCERPLVEKIRYRVQIGGLCWEIDEFLGDNEGLVIAEIELTAEDQPFEKPSWAGEDVTGDPRYYNSNLGKNPWRRWKQQ